jgi:hypothetical protein
LGKLKLAEIEGVKERVKNVLTMACCDPRMTEKLFGQLASILKSGSVASEFKKLEAWLIDDFEDSLNQKNYPRPKGIELDVLSRRPIPVH